MKRVQSERLISNWHRSTTLTKTQMEGYVEGEWQDVEGSGRMRDQKRALFRGIKMWNVYLK